MRRAVDHDPAPVFDESVTMVHTHRVVSVFLSMALVWNCTGYSWGSIYQCMCFDLFDVHPKAIPVRGTIVYLAQLLRNQMLLCRQSSAMDVVVDAVAVRTKLQTSGHF